MSVRKVGEKSTRAIAQSIDGFRDLITIACLRDDSGGGEALDIAREFLDAVRADAEAEILGRDVFELVGFVQNRVAAGRNHLAKRVLPDRRIGAEQMVVDDDDVGLGGALTHSGHKTFVVAWTL